MIYANYLLWQEQVQPTDPDAIKTLLVFGGVIVILGIIKMFGHYIGHLENDPGDIRDFQEPIPLKPKGKQ